MPPRDAAARSPRRARARSIVFAPSIDRASIVFARRSTTARSTRARRSIARARPRAGRARVEIPAGDSSRVPIREFADLESVDVSVTFRAVGRPRAARRRAATAAAATRANRARIARSARARFARPNRARARTRDAIGGSIDRSSLGRRRRSIDRA